MAKVYTGQVVIRGDQLEDYVAALEEAERKKAPFREQMEKLNHEFGCELEKRYSERTVRKHMGTVAMFSEFLEKYTDVMNIQEITRGLANTHFRRWYKKKVWNSATEQDLKVGLRKFFLFLGEKGIEFDQKILAGLQ